jgi:hypothetical protein
MILCLGGYSIALFSGEDDDAILEGGTISSSIQNDVMELRRAAHPTHTAVRAVLSDEDLSSVIPYQPHTKKLIVTRDKPETVTDTTNNNNAAASMTNVVARTTTANPLEGLPGWMRKYLEWHQYMRHIYPDDALINDPSAPGVLIKYCTTRCGGLNDRLGTLHHAVYAAAQTNRVLLLKWFIPAPLESFLESASINWSVPAMERFKYKHIAVEDNGVTDENVSNNTHFLFDWTPTSGMRNKYKNALEHVKDQLASRMVILFKNWGHPAVNVVEELPAAGEHDLFGDDDDIGGGSSSKSFGILWNAFFKPAPAVQQTLDETMSLLQLQPGKYSAVHCRVGRPGRFAASENPEAKKLEPFVGPHNEMAVSTALHAIQCSRWLTRQEHNPLLSKDEHEPM